jgi:hypothetical protein
VHCCLQIRRRCNRCGGGSSDSVENSDADSGGPGTTSEDDEHTNGYNRTHRHLDRTMISLDGESSSEVEKPLLTRSGSEYLSISSHIPRNR